MASHNTPCIEHAIPSKMSKCIFPARIRWNNRASLSVITAINNIDISVGAIFGSPYIGASWAHTGIRLKRMRNLVGAILRRWGMLKAEIRNNCLQCIAPQSHGDAYTVPKFALTPLPYTALTKSCVTLVYFHTILSNIHQNVIKSAFSALYKIQMTQ